MKSKNIDINYSKFVGTTTFLVVFCIWISIFQKATTFFYREVIIKINQFPGALKISQVASLISRKIWVNFLPSISSISLVLANSIASGL